MSCGKSRGLFQTKLSIKKELMYHAQLIKACSVFPSTAEMRVYSCQSVVYYKVIVYCRFPKNFSEISR